MYNHSQSKMLLKKLKNIQTLEKKGKWTIKLLTSQLYQNADVEIEGELEYMIVNTKHAWPPESISSALSDYGIPVSDYQAD